MRKIAAMEIINLSVENRISNTIEKSEVLQYLENKVKELITSHLLKRKLWFSNDFLPSEEQMSNDRESVKSKLKQRAKGIKDQVRAALAINLLTEEGLPHFHTLLTKYLGDDSFWVKWTNMWTAEEDRHGNVIRDYVRDSHIFNFRDVELMQFHYVEAGFNPDWEMDPYKVFVYTTLQERATQISHKNTGKAAEEEEPLLGKILSNIGADEAKHYSFYRSIFKEILNIDPDGALISAASIMPAIEMPGLSMPNFRELSDVVRRTGIYTPWHYKEIVEEVIKFWDIESITGISEAASKAQEKIMSIPARLKKIAQYIDEKTKSKTFSFDFIYDRFLRFE
jgi:acyl-[acyl-carrier-protein] desaturase